MGTHRVLVTAVGGNVGQGVIKGLRAAKRSFHIVGIDLEILSAGFYMADAHYCTPRVNAPSFQSVFEDIIREEKIEAVYVCSHAELAYFSEHKESLETKLGITILVNPFPVVQIGADKYETAEFLKRNGFPYPETALGDDKPEIDLLIEKRGFPLIVKPRRGFSSKNVFIVNSREEMNAALTLVQDVVVQQYLADAAREYTATTISGKHGKVLASIVLHRDLIQGTTYRTELLLDDAVTHQLETIANRLGAVGVCNFQFRIEANTVYVFEINPRFSGTGGIRFLYGFNDSEMVFELLRLGMEISRPEMTQSVVLRYWNEIVVPGATFQSLRGNKTCS